MSVVGGFDQALDRGEATGCETIQILTKNNRQWDAPPLTTAQVDAFLARRQTSAIDPVFVHGIYLINLCSPQLATRERSRLALIDELERAERLQLPWVIIHPGSHGGQGDEEGLRQIAEETRRAIDATPHAKARVCLETTAGQGTALGHRFEHLARLYELIDAEERLGVCLDTCHIFSAGYDLRTPEAYAATMAEFDRTVGLRRLACLHLNDSKTPFAERKDRHEHIGAGTIGQAPFGHVLTDPRLQHVPMVIETPVDGDEVEDDRRNLAALRALL